MRPVHIALAVLVAALWGLNFVVIAFVATTFGWAAWAHLLHAYSAGTVAPFSLLVPVFGLGFAALLLGEPLTERTVAAAVLVVCGVLLTQRAPRISPDVAGTPPRPILRDGAPAG